MGKHRRSRPRDEGTSQRDDEAEGIARGARLRELIRQEVNLLLRNEIRDRRLDGVSITMVELAGDGSCARLWWSAEGTQDRTEALDGAGAFIRSQLAEGLALKRTPEIRFRRDPATRAPMPRETD